MCVLGLLVLSALLAFQVFLKRFECLDLQVVLSELLELSLNSGLHFAELRLRSQLPDEPHCHEVVLPLKKGLPRLTLPFCLFMPCFEQIGAVAAIVGSLQLGECLAESDLLLNGHAHLLKDHLL